MVPAFIRRLPIWAAAGLALLVLPATALAGCPRAGAAPTSPRALSTTLCLLNAQRAAHGLAPLAADARLQKAAGAYARDMVARRFFDHTSPDGGTLLQRLHAAGWRPAGDWTAGENIAWGSGDLATPAKIVNAWMHSPGHRANILSAAFTQIGLGIAAGAPMVGVPGTAGTYVTDFGAGDAAVPVSARR